MHAGAADEQLNPKKKVFEAVQPDLAVRDDLVAAYKVGVFGPFGAGCAFGPPTGGGGAAVVEALTDVYHYLHRLCSQGVAFTTSKGPCVVRSVKGAGIK
jgi:hypothetical protein